MRVLVDCTPLSVGGGVQVAIALLAHLAQHDSIAWQAVIPSPIVPTLPSELKHDPRLRFVSKGGLPQLLALSLKLRRLERAFRPDVVFTVFGPAYFRARAPHAVGFALPNLIYERTSPLPAAGMVTQLKDWVRCTLLRQADQLIVETHTVRTRLASRLRIDPGRILVIGNSVNPLLARTFQSSDVRNRRFGILIPSAYYVHKNLEIVPHVASAMRRNRPGFDFEFRFTLPHGSDDWRRLVAHARQLGVEGCIVTLGVLAIGELANAYEEASAVFLPTLREASTAVYPESFFFRRPLVTSDLDFARELCGDAALFVPPRDPESIAKSLISLAQSPDLRARLVEVGERQLSRVYPNATDKFAMQMTMLRSLSENVGHCRTMRH